ncbi:MAG TPA: hypothetical protein VJU83_09640 [Burkholderiales bacterium]|nr:hypothetical protein [Burkholderiales bacterium]
MIRYCCIRIGNWKLLNWRLYRLTLHVDAKTNGSKARWNSWDRIL